MKTIGVFDSGVGGLSVLRALLAELPGQRFVYAADGGHAPYGERTPEFVSQRTHLVTQHLRETYAIDALVVACNTATALAIDDLRLQYPHMPIVGVEPALKPAAALSRNGRIGVLATRGTLGSARVAALRDRLVATSPRPLHFRFQPCDGLAGAIERHDTAAIETLSARYVHELLHAGVSGDEEPIDTVVLGCTHYPFAADLLGELSGPGVMLVETGVPVARRTREVLGLPAPEEGMTPASTTLLSTGDPLALADAAHRWLGLRVDAHALAV
ncbi:glutamate racemase [Hydrogenophaga sp. BPS33]|uniref:glutamate racemase n=1 Tax=Hydrogenophaga sp. BPS33 TaxID=2651974 RepID=UPI00131FAD5C|nr:glutamate racemase [Hydrogenophaga sp. BPS33]QHE86490.1 glutamate racemase [Hydrogenophaga sp. BPS33]